MFRVEFSYDIGCSLCGTLHVDVEINTRYACTHCKRTDGMDCYMRFLSDTTRDLFCDVCKCHLKFDLVYVKHGQPNAITCLDFADFAGDKTPSRCYDCSNTTPVVRPESAIKLYNKKRKPDSCDDLCNECHRCGTFNDTTSKRCAGCRLKF